MTVRVLQDDCMISWCLLFPAGSLKPKTLMELEQLNRAACADLAHACIRLVTNIRLCLHLFYDIYKQLVLVLKNELIQ